MSEGRPAQEALLSARMVNTDMNKAGHFLVGNTYRRNNTIKTKHFLLIFAIQARIANQLVISILFSFIGALVIRRCLLMDMVAIVVVVVVEGGVGGSGMMWLVMIRKVFRMLKMISIVARC